eukprot:g280.t1
MVNISQTRASDASRKKHDRVKANLFGPDEIDPFVRVTIGKGPTKITKSTGVVKNGGVNCVFTKDNVLELDFPSTTYTANEENSLNVLVSAWDKDYIGADDLIGTGTINLMELAKKTVAPEVKEIELPIKHKGKFTGIVVLTIQILFNDDNKPTDTNIPSGTCKLVIKSAEELYTEGTDVLDDEGNVLNFIASVFVLSLSLAGYAVFFSLYEGWYFTYGLYFAVVTFSTVGYGDLSPETNLGKIFVTCTGLFGVAIGGVCFNNILSYILTVYGRLRGCCKRMDKRKKLKAQKASLNKVSPSDKSMKSIMIEDGFDNNKQNGKKKGTMIDNSMKKKVIDILYMFLILLAMLFLGTFVFMQLEGWTFIDSLYVSMITLLTIGYGDMSPETDYGRFFCLFWLVFGFTYVGRILSSVSETYIQYKTQKMRKKILTSTVTKTMILNMDENGDGKLDRIEFLTNMIFLLGMGDKSEIAEIMKRYDEYEASQKSLEN